MDGADVPGIGPGGNGDADRLKRLQILQRDIVSFLNRGEDSFGLRYRGLETVRHFVGWQFGYVEGGDHFRIAPRFLFRGQLQFVRESAAVTFEHDQRRGENRALFLEERDEALIDQLVGDAVDQEVGAFLDRGAGGLELGRMHRHAQFQPVAFLDDRLHYRPENRGAFDIGLARRRRRLRRWHDIPNL